MTIATWGDLLVKKEYKMTKPILQNRDYTLSVAGTMGRNSVVAMLGNDMVIGRLKNNTITFRITDFTEEDTIVLICPEGGSITHAQLERGNKASDWTPAPEDAQARIDNTVNSLKNEAIPALKDGLLNSSEKEAVKQSLNVVSADKKGIDMQYTTVYANTALTGTAKSNLKSAKDALNTAFTNMQSAINAVLAVGDGTRITTTQMTLVTTRLNEYGTALSTYNQRYEQAQDAISMKYVDDVEVGGRNLIVQSTITRGKFLTVTGSESINAGWFYTDFIPVSNYKNLVTSGYSILGDSPSVVYYNSSKVFVKGINNGNLERAKNITIDSGIAFIRFSGMLVDLPTLKLEKGNKATDWSPAPEDARTYKAWANSSEGSVDFTRVYPNENLLLESSQSVTNSNYNIRSYPLADDTLTATDDVVITIKGALGADRNSFRAYNSGGTYAICTFTSLGNGIYQYKGKWNPNGGNSSLVIYQFNSTNTSSSTIEWIKLERGTTPTVYTTNTADSLTESIPKYIGLSPLDSNKPSDYEWIINPEWSMEYTSSKIEQTSENITLEVKKVYAAKTEVDEKILADKKIKDTRNDNQTPLWYWQNHPRVITKELKLNSVLGISDAGEFATLESDMLWSDYSAGAITQTAKTNVGLYQRRSSSTTAWSAWAKIADSRNIVSQINISPESIRIASKKIEIKGDTYIENGVIKSAHIDNLSASKITAGTLNAALVSISASSGNKQVLLNSDGISTKDDTGKLRMSIGVRDLGGVGQSDPANIVFYSGNGKNSMYIGTNVNDTFVIAPASGNMDSLFMMPKGLTISSRQLRLTDPRGTSDFIEIKRTVDGTNEMIIFPSRPFSGQLGSADANKWFRVMRASQIVGHTLNVGYGAGSPHLGDISVGADSGSPAAGSTQAFVRSRAIYNRIYGSQPTVCVTDYGTLGRIVSARKYKEQISEATTVIQNAKDILKIVPSEWYIKGRLDKREYGFIADDFHELGLTEVVQYGTDGQVEGLAYDRISMYLVEILKDHERQLNNMRINTNGELWQLKCQIEELKKEVKDLKQVSEEKGGGYIE